MVGTILIVANAVARALLVAAVAIAAGDQIDQFGFVQIITAP